MHDNVGFHDTFTGLLIELKNELKALASFKTLHQPFQLQSMTNQKL
jgi:hypothetical protein